MDKHTLTQMIDQHQLQIYFGEKQTIITNDPKGITTPHFKQVIAKIDETKAHRYQIKAPAQLSKTLHQSIIEYAKVPIQKRLQFIITQA